MYSFKNDYSEGAHPQILQVMIETNHIQEEGYGYDFYTKKAIEVLKQKMNNADIDIHLLSGGTQTNLTAISAFLRPHEAVVAPETGHIFVNEAGAIEATGHKVITVKGKEGKLSPEQIKPVLEKHSDVHTVSPKMIYISNPTEIGTVYKKAELKELRAFCDEHRLLLYIDGARLGSALSSPENDLTLAEMCTYADSFYIGATKAGGLLGEAIVICNDQLKDGFRINMKQKGALLAKSRLLGIQFHELFKGHLYFDLSEHANEMAGRLQRGIKECGFDFLVETTTNQIFPIFPDRVIERLQEEYLFYVWERMDDSRSAIRLITSWATEEDKVVQFVNDLKRIKEEAGIQDKVMS